MSNKLWNLPDEQKIGACLALEELRVYMTQLRDMNRKQAARGTKQMDTNANIRATAYTRVVSAIEGTIMEVTGEYPPPLLASALEVPPKVG